MKKAAFFFSILCSCLISSNVYAEIRLNEILADPASDWNGDGSIGARYDEWVEITNAGTAPVDLSAYRLSDESGGYSWRFAFSGVIAPGEVRVVYGSDAIAWQNASGRPAYGLSLNNAGDTVFLYRVDALDTVLVDSYTYSAFEVLDDRSVGRNPDAPAEWVIFDGLNPYGGSTPPLGSGCNPSPGAGNACVTPVENSTWGAIKAIYKSR